MIELRNITWRAPGGGFCLTDISLVIPSNTYAVLMGGTGTGKTSLLEVLCGLHLPLSGQVLLDGLDVTESEPWERAIGYVPQDSALFPHRRVRDQIGFALRVRGETRTVIEERVRDLAQELRITPILDRFPEALSGGEKQRVALGRALAATPKVLLLDEPLSALDESMRTESIRLLQAVQAQHRLTVLHVTHSHQEAAVVGELHLRLDGGRVAQIKPL